MRAAGLRAAPVPQGQARAEDLEAAFRLRPVLCSALSAPPPRPSPSVSGSFQLSTKVPLKDNKF